MSRLLASFHRLCRRVLHAQSIRGLTVLDRLYRQAEVPTLLCMVSIEH